LGGIYTYFYNNADLQNVLIFCKWISDVGKTELQGRVTIR